ncbi:MAG: hypothetical protein FJ297_07980 [Planctomycetes bacterium]|nr:hypothetical protein [Planctomycetota bacterium]
MTGRRRASIDRTADSVPATGDAGPSPCADLRANDCPASPPPHAAERQSEPKADARDVDRFEAEWLAAFSEASPASGDEPSHETPSLHDDVAWERESARIEQLLAELELTAIDTSGEPIGGGLRIDSPHRDTRSTSRAARRHPIMATDSHSESKDRHVSASWTRDLAPRISWPCWITISFGLMLFVCGGVLVGWSYISARAELMRIGLPLTLSGQVLLVLGLILQLEFHWKHTRRTNAALARLHGDLHRLEHATTLLAATHSMPAQSFYAHLAEGAGPRLLLADLKGQLDLLAARLAPAHAEPGEFDA